MKSILVPIENPENMNSILETVLLLAQRWDSYIEGFALRFRISESMAIDTAGIGLESYHNESLEEAAKAAKMFE
jgi:hypothetical protein